jgi:putative heme-binding domain-containing protein
MAALSASSDEALPTLESAVRSEQSAGRASYVQQLGSMIGARNKPGEVAKVLQLAASTSAPQSDWWRAAMLDGMAAGLRSRHASQQHPVLLKLYADRAAGVRQAALRLIEITGLPANAAAVIKQAVATASDRGQAADQRAGAIRLLSMSTVKNPASFYQGFVQPSEPEEVQIASVQAMGKENGTGSAVFLLSKWRTMTPAVRGEAGSSFLSDPERFKLLLNAIEQGDVQPWSLPLRQRIQMQMNADPSLRDRARSLLAAKAGDRDAVLKRYQAVLDKTTGDASKGKAVFEKTCSKCHRMDGVGAEVGPDLATIRNRTASSLLGDILIPSRSIAQMYEAYVVETTSGGTLEGVIGEQTSTTITLVHEQGKKDIVSRSDIKQMFASNLSAMPEDVDKEITPEQMVDLITYLKNPK